MRAVWLVAMVAFLAAPDALACWEEAAQRFELDPGLLYAIAKCESSLRSNVVNRSHRARTGTYDIGLMQVNSSNLARLGTYGISEQQLFDACTNVHVGAWILATKIHQYGPSWEAVGAYNAACTERKGNDCRAARSKYAWCVYRNLPGASAQRSSGLGTQSVASIPIIAVRIAP